MGQDAAKKRLRVAGDIEKDSIQRKGSEVAFVLVGENQKLPVIYTGTEPLPDTFRDGAQALAEGKMGPDGAFHAAKIQAKCASKYEVKPGLYKPTETNPKISLNNQGTYRLSMQNLGSLAVLLALYLFCYAEYV